jgi:hypothetical protein
MQRISVFSHGEPAKAACPLRGFEPAGIHYPGPQPRKH